MRLIADAEARRLLDPEGAMAAVAAALRRLGTPAAAMQMRLRTAAGPVKLSTMAAIDLEEGVAGAKVYTTVGGRFRFIVLLFATDTGAPVAAIEADGLTAIRTAAVTAVAARLLAPADPGTLAIFGTGIQAEAHGRLLPRIRPLRRIRVVSRGDARPFCARLAEATGLPVTPADATAALDGAGMVVTATRATQPLFPAGLLAPGAFVAAIGATLPGNAEVGCGVVEACRVVVECRSQAQGEAGDLVRAAGEGRFDWRRAEELGPLLRAPPAPPDGRPVLFKSIGIAPEDLACAALIWRRAHETPSP